jgi:hypothetical protein
MNSAIEKIHQSMHVKGFIDGKWQALFFGYDCYGAPDIATVHQTFGEKAGNDWRAFIQKRRDEIHASTCLSTIGGGTNPVFGTKISGIEVLPGDCFAFECKSGYAISSGSADRIRIVNADSSNTATGTITILGSQ